MNCPKCASEIPQDAPAGICPKCLMEAGLSSQVDPQETTGPSGSAAGGFVPPEPAALEQLFPQLEILELLGHGGMGAVYKARQRQLDRLVAVKILLPEIAAEASFAERFRREAQALARLSHPNVVAVHDVGQAGELYYIIMEYVDGLNLREVLRRGELDPQEALAIVPQICDALQYAHDQGVVHRDIKPENVLVDTKGRVKIADFGLAKLLGLEPSESHLTQTRHVMGTPHYMAPEQMQGTRDVDHRADIYALGVVFYELLTGEVPTGRFEPPSQRVQVDVRLDEVVLRALDREPSKRYQQASAIKTEVESIISSGYIAPEAPAETVSDAVYSRRLIWIFAFCWLVWMGLMVFDLVSYVRGVEWYFENDEIPADYLRWGQFYLSLMLLFFFGLAWYTLAKSPGVPRSLDNFVKTAQTPDRRIRYLWIAALAYGLAYTLAMIVTMLFTPDAVQATTMYLFLIAAPPVAMASNVWVYRKPRRR